MLRLRTLGGVYVANAEGAPLGGAATQRRLLALLAALAVAGERGLSRDKLVALLWPESDDERGRHSLTQALYGARRALGLDDLFVINGDIRLNRDHITADVQDLEEALEAGELERAVEIYKGPFADGFFLPGSGDFERWTAVQRARLEDRITDALDRLAERAEAAGRTREALDWRKRLAVIRPLDTSAAVALVTTLAHIGDRAGALQHARLHETLLREQLGLHPDPVLTSLVAQLREPVERKPAPTSRERDLPEAEASPPTATAPPIVAAERMPPSSSARRNRYAWWTATAGLVALAVVFALHPRPGPPRDVTATPTLDQKVVVAPFRVAGATSSLGYLREGMVELLSTRLADDSSARSVDAGAVLAAWRAAGLASPTDVSRATILHLARELGAERVVIGSVVGTASRIVLSAAVVDVASREASGDATVEGHADSISVLVDRLAARLLVIGAGEEISLSDRTTESLSALRAFLSGQAAFRRANYVVALRWYEETLRLDSTFALAAVQLARAADRLQMVEPRIRALAIAWRERPALDSRARALLLALSGPGYPAVPDADELVAVWERVADLTPDRADAWFELGARLLQEGAVAGAQNARSRGVRALRRALQLEPTHRPSRELLARITYALPQSEQLKAPANVGISDSVLPLSPFLMWRDALARGDSAELGRARRNLTQLGPRNLRAIAVTALVEAVSVGDARRAVQQLRSRADRLDERIDAALAEHAVALNQGRLHDALAAADRLGELRAGAHADLRLRVLDALYGDGDSASAVAVVAQLHRTVASRSTTEARARAVQRADACVLAQWRLLHGDTTGVLATIGMLQTEPALIGTVLPTLGTTPLACAELLRAMLAVELRSPSAGSAVARLDSLAFTVGASGDAIAYAPLLIARLHARLGDSRAAFDAVRRRDNQTGWPRYLAPGLREEGRYAALAGANDEARLALRRYLALRSDPDPGLQAQVSAVQRELAALSQ